jgi:ABC-2 type transport system permease protein
MTEVQKLTPTPSAEIYDSAQRGPRLIEEISELYKYRNLVSQFVSRNLKTRYKRSALGVVWTLLNPLLTMVVLTLVFSNVFKFDVANYPVYILSGLVIWNFFSATTQTSMGEIMWSGSLLNRIYVPKSAFPVASVGAGLVNLLLSLIPLFGIALILGVTIRPAILVIPASILLLTCFALGVGLFLATAAVYFADVLPVYEVLLTLWMYATPIIYPIEIIPPNWQWLFRLNPLLHLVRLFRAPLYEGVIPEWQTWAIGAAFSLLSLAAGALIFTSKSDEYNYRI